jgi:glycosyltransferase involved in cell wall biosynthesis
VSDTGYVSDTFMPKPIGNHDLSVPVDGALSTEENFPDRSADEKAIIERQFKGGGYGGQAYCAPPAPGWDVKGLWHYFPAHTRAGYSVHAIALHRMLLDAMKIPTSLIPHRMAGLDIDQFPKDRADMLVKWMADAVGIPEAIIVSLPPDLGMYDIARALVNYVAGPECTKVSEHARDIVNSDSLTALWCVSPFTARAYTNGGVNPNKVFVVRPPICDGIWRDMFTPLDQLSPVHRQEETFVFGTLGTWHERKGFHDLVRAYFRTFKRDQPVELHIRTSSFDSTLTIKKFEEKVISEIAKIAADEFGDADYPASKKQPKIKLLSGTALSEQGVIDWLGTLDCYVDPSYGEGLGIPPMWAMAQGVPLITSDFGAVGEFCTGFGSRMAQPFPSRLEPVPASMRGHAAIWGETSSWGGYDIANLSELMRTWFSTSRSRFPIDAAAVRSHFSYAACVGGLRDALQNVCRPEVLDGWYTAR